MKKSNLLSHIWAISTIMIFASTNLMAQQAATITKPSPQQVAVNRAEANLAKIEAKLNIADSLIAIGNSEYKDAESAIDSNNAERKILDKEYTAKKKALDKLVTSKDKQTAAKAKADLKALDSEYKAAVKESDADLKINLKKSDEAQKNLAKGQTLKKENSKLQKQAKKTLDTANANLNKPEGTKGKKK